MFDQAPVSLSFLTQFKHLLICCWKCILRITPVLFLPHACILIWHKCIMTLREDHCLNIGNYNTNYKEVKTLKWIIIHFCFTMKWLKYLMYITLCNTPKIPELGTFIYLMKKSRQREVAWLWSHCSQWVLTDQIIIENSIFVGTFWLQDIRSTISWPPPGLHAYPFRSLLLYLSLPGRYFFFLPPTAHTCVWRFFWWPPFGYCT